jgi:hypothetical protein
MRLKLKNKLKRKFNLKNVDKSYGNTFFRKSTEKKTFKLKLYLFQFPR